MSTIRFDGAPHRKILRTKYHVVTAEKTDNVWTIYKDSVEYWKSKPNDSSDLHKRMYQAARDA